MCVLSFNVFNRCSLVQLKKQNRWMSKEMSVTIKENWCSQIFDFLWKKIWGNALEEQFLKNKKVYIRYIRGSNFGIIVFSCLLSLNLSQIFLNMFYSGDKRLLSEFLRKWGWFHGHSECSPSILATNQNFKKLRQGFVDESTMITMTLTPSCQWTTLVPFCLWKK